MVLLDMPMSREYFLAQFDVVRTLVANGLGYTLANVPRRRTRPLRR
jgi:hypothetical protein